MQYLCTVAPFGDCYDCLCNKPEDIIACIGIALSILLSNRLMVFNNNKLIPMTLFPRIVTSAVSVESSNAVKYAIPLTPYAQLRSNAVGKLVCVFGYVVRVGKCKPLVEYATFHCSKCNGYTQIHLDEGIFCYPSMCATPG